MCICAEVSYSLAASLLVGGTYCVRKAQQVDRSYVALALTPVIFGVQQMCEGGVWSGLKAGNPQLTHIAAFGYLFFALLFWPIWIPFTAQCIEPSNAKKWFMRFMMSAGVMLALLLIVPLAIHPAWFSVEVFHHSLHYSVTSSPVFGILPDPWWEPLYFIVVATPLFISSERKFINAGIAAVLSAAATHIFFHHVFATVWCFFGAVLSLYLCVYFARLARRANVAKPLLTVVQ